MCQIHLLNFVESHKAWELFAIAINIGSIVRQLLLIGSVEIRNQIINKFDEDFIDSQIERRHIQQPHYVWAKISSFDLRLSKEILISELGSFFLLFHNGDRLQLLVRNH